MQAQTDAVEDRSSGAPQLSGILDVVLAPVVEGPDRMEISFGKNKRVERLTWVVTVGDMEQPFLEGRLVTLRSDDGFIQVDAPKMHWVWNNPLAMIAPKQSQLWANVKDILSQMARYSGPRGNKYAWASNLVYTWFIKMEKGKFFVSKAYPCLAYNPTVLAVSIPASSCVFQAVTVLF
eukprot:GHUV01049731.1.p2 GENE.GHUV01049731.1~~GHUV01049731.1.p2  ORF type:complete len:178 (+),score=42.01 GHUV01049731.1:1148-1681(+)